MQTNNQHIFGQALHKFLCLCLLLAKAFNGTVNAGQFLRFEIELKIAFCCSSHLEKLTKKDNSNKILSNNTNYRQPFNE